MCAKSHISEKLTGENDNQLEMIKKISLSFDEFIICLNIVKMSELLFINLLIESITFLTKLNSGLFKIPLVKSPIYHI